MEMTLEQQRAIALANARRRAAEAEAAPSAPAPNAGQSGALDADNATRALARGTPFVGSWLDELNAATNATLAPVVDPMLPDTLQKLPQATWKERYDAALAIQRGKDKAFDEQNPGASTGLQIAGGVGTGAAALKAAAAGPGIARTVVTKALGMGGKSLPGKMGAGLAAGGGEGIVRGAGDGEGTDRILPAAQGGLIGSAAGAAIPLAGAAIGSGIRAGVNAVKGMSSPVSGRAARMVADDLAAEGKTIPDAAARAKDIGPQGMLADTSETLRLRAEQIAQSDNPARGPVISALKERSGAAGERIGSAYDETLGKAPNVYRVMKDMSAATKAHADELYGQARAENLPVNVEPVVKAIDDMLLSPVDSIVNPGSGLPDDAVDSALKFVRNNLMREGEQRTGIDKLDKLERRIRARVDASFKSGRTDEGHALNEVRKVLVAQMKASSPVYKMARETFSDDKSVEDAFEMGRSIFSSKTHPDFFAATVDEMSLAERDALRLGSRAAADEVMGRVKNGAVKGRDLLDADWNERKLRQALGDDADKLIATLAGEQEMGTTASQALGNSASSRRLDNPFAKRTLNPGSLDPTVLGVANRALKAGVNAWQGRGRDALATEMAPLLVSQGAQRDALVEALTRRAAGSSRAADAGGKSDALVRALLQSGTNPLEDQYLAR